MRVFILATARPENLDEVSRGDPKASDAQTFHILLIIQNIN